MSDPVAFGTARLDEDEKRAQAMKHFTVDGDEFYSCPAARTEPLGDLEWGEENCQCGLAVRKARALREVAAKRRLLELADEADELHAFVEQHNGDGQPAPGESCGEKIRAAIASVYDQERKP